MPPEDLLTRLKAFEGARLGEPWRARDPVNEPMIHHWCDAVGDRNPSYTDSEFARGSAHGGIVAPPTMLQAWTMPGLAGRDSARARSVIRSKLFRLLDEAGFTSVVATNCTQQYHRYLVPGDQITTTMTIESVSEEKRTALGTGHFITQRMSYTDQKGEEVATMRFRLLRFKPRAEGRTAPEPAPVEKRRNRPRPALTHDNRFFWDGVAKRVLLIQRCASCGELRHPPGPMCPDCRSLDWDTVEASGRGRVYSFVVAHHPVIPPFAYPNAIALVELEEGTRIVSNLVGIDPAAIEVGMDVTAEFHELEEDRVFLQFTPAR